MTPTEQLALENLAQRLQERIYSLSTIAAHLNSRVPAKDKMSEADLFRPFEDLQALVNELEKLATGG